MIGEIMKIIEEPFETYQGEDVTKVTLTNDCDVSISCLTLGATWYEFLVPDKHKSKKNIIMNFTHCADYYSNGLCCSQSIGRVAGRIKDGRFELNDQKVQLSTNENGNTLHGGNNGFRFLNWKVTTSKTEDAVSAVFTNEIKADVDSFPGNLAATIVYTLDNQNRVTISYQAENGPEATLFNPTCHVYFNLSDQSNLNSHELKINSSKYLQLDSELIPTGKMISVENTPYDFRDFENLGDAIQKNAGFDDAFVINGETNEEKSVAVLREKNSGRQVTITSESNCLVVYTMSQEQPGVRFVRDHGELAKPSEAVALEAQILPDAINHSNFGNIVLPANAKEMHKITFSFKQK